MQVSSLGAIAGIMLAGAIGMWAGQPAPPPDVTVALHCEVLTTPGVVARAKHMAKEIFDSIGVTLAWRGEMTDLEQGVLIKVDLQPGPAGESTSLGEASPFAREHAIIINYNAVKRAAGISRQLEPIILTHVLVHEITHVLQGVNRHAETGMMKARWTPEDYCEMEWKPLEFTQEDVELIRLGLVVLRGQRGR